MLNIFHIPHLYLTRWQINYGIRKYTPIYIYKWVIYIRNIYTRTKFSFAVVGPAHSELCWYLSLVTTLSLSRLESHNRRMRSLFFLLPTMLSFPFFLDLVLFSIFSCGFSRPLHVLSLWYLESFKHVGQNSSPHLWQWQWPSSTLA